MVLVTVLEAPVLLIITSWKVRTPSPLASTRENSAGSCGPSSSGVRVSLRSLSSPLNPAAASRASSASLTKPSPSVSAASNARRS